MMIPNIAFFLEIFFINLIYEIKLILKNQYHSLKLIELTLTLYRIYIVNRKISI